MIFANFSFKRQKLKAILKIVVVHNKNRCNNYVIWHNLVVQKRNCFKSFFFNIYKASIMKLFVCKRQHFNFSQSAVGKAFMEFQN